MIFNFTSSIILFQTSRELKIAGTIGPCVSLNVKGPCVSENVRKTFSFTFTSFTLGLAR